MGVETRLAIENMQSDETEASRPLRLKTAPRCADQPGVRCCAARWLLAGFLALAPVALGAEDACRERRYGGDLAALFVAPSELGPGWDSVRETASDPDPDMAEAGVLATRSLHYTRRREGGSQVCSLEIWAFASPAAARRARAQIERDGWRIDPLANLLLMARGVTLSRGDGFRPGLLAECHRLADLTEAGVRQRLGCSDPKSRDRAH